MAVYQGYRPILPSQNSNDWKHGVTGEKGVYSNYQLQSSVHLLDEAPLKDVEPGEGDYPGNTVLSQMFTGKFSYKPMELAKYSHGGQDAPYLHHDIHEFHGVTGSKVFPSTFGHDGTREFNFSRYVSYGQDGLESRVKLDGGHTQRAYGEGIVNHGPTANYVHDGVGDEALEDPGSGSDVYGYQKINEWSGVASAKAL